MVRRCLERAAVSWLPRGAGALCCRPLPITLAAGHSRCRDGGDVLLPAMRLIGAGAAAATPATQPGAQPAGSALRLTA